MKIWVVLDYEDEVTTDLFGVFEDKESAEAAITNHVEKYFKEEYQSRARERYEILTCEMGVPWIRPDDEWWKVHA